ncbi:MAG: hypothetical protein ACRDK7_10805 [Solirubrobacteraceae bacterium]
MVRLSDDALSKLLELRVELIETGEVFWLPAELVCYRGKAKSRPCIVAACDGARAHLVPGTSQRASGPALTVEVGETRLMERTQFDFSIAFPLALRDLAARGRSAGALPAERLSDLHAAIDASNLIALKRLVAK